MASDASRDGLADDAKDATIDAKPACTLPLWDPASSSIDRWPDPRFVVPDRATPTGVRLRVDRARFASALRSAGPFSTLYTDLDGLDGFGVNAQAFFRFNRPFDRARLPSAEQTLGATAGVGFVVFGPGAPRLEGALVTTADDGATLMLAPLRPLPEGTRVAAYVSRRLTTAAGGCLDVTDAVARELSAPSPEAVAAIEALRALGVITAARDLVALTPFVTQSIVRDSRAVAADMMGRTSVVSARHPCTDDVTRRYRRCMIEFVAGNYLDAAGHLPEAGATGLQPQSMYTLKATVWLPTMARGARPYPTIVYGHGLGGDRSQAARLAEFAAPEGYATVALDAVAHGEHPLNPTPGAQTLPVVIRFFSLDIDATRPFDGRALRDRFRQSTYDKLQLVQLLRGGLDVDGDGTVDLDGNRLAYLGVSLGGIMGVEPLALTDAFGAAVLVVPGGRVSAIISESSTFAPILRLVRPAGTSVGDVERAFPLLQTILDPGDAASYGPHVFVDRLVPGGSRTTPSALVGVVLDDDTVPNVSNETLARAMGLSVVPPLLRPVPGMTVLPEVPVAGNFAMGRATGGMLQFDVVAGPTGQSVRATHANVAASDVGVAAWMHFLRTHWTRGLAEINDPYAVVGRMHGGL
jgi:dienelactone hydrolase